MSDAATTPSTATKLVAEALGTFLLVFGAIGTALVAGEVVGVLGISLAFGLTILAGIYAWGPISGGHFNPAVTVGLAAAGRFAWKDAPGYIIAQIIGGALGTTLIVLIGLFGPEGWLTAAQDGGFASNGFGGASPGGFGLGAAIIAEILFTAIFVLIILGGKGRLFGPVAGAMLYVLIEYVLGGITERWQFFLGLVLLMVVLFARGGLLGLLAGKARHG